jgi:asparagine synthase (glutamine-hydrolysing)
MCGISGEITWKGSGVVPEDVRSMSDAIRHRGPDGDGYLFMRGGVFFTAYGDDTPQAIRHSSSRFAPAGPIQTLEGRFDFGFAHRRLAILDLGENGYQPLCDEQRKVWITYNGEIYNYIELKAELQKKGHAFYTRTDTEVILAAYAEWGTECVTHFNGMWAFVLYDAGKNIFFGSRDRFGVKPFYYYRAEGMLLFASEQKALLKHSKVRSGINPLAIADYFIAGEIEYREEGVFQNILELFPSCSFTINAVTGDFNKWVYYTLKTTTTYEAFHPDRFIKYRDHCAELIRQAVARRMRSDVPVGSCLSGGIDSSALVGLMRSLSGKQASINTFTAAFSQKEFDESHWARLVANENGAVSHFSSPTREELVKDIESLVYSQDAPIWSTSTYAQYRVMKLVKEAGIKVVLDGQGGDELFGGYQPHYTWYLADHLRNFRYGKAVSAINSFGSFPENLKSLGKDFLKYKSIQALPPALQFRIQKKYFSDLSYLNKDLIDLYNKARTAPGEENPRTLNDILLKEFVNTRLKGYLKCEDRCSMWHSVESRSPFSDDHPLIEYVFNIPGNYKIHNGIHKYLMREAVRPYIPAPVLQRRDKMGYASPNNKWVTEMREEMRPYFTENLRPYLNLDKLMKDYNSFFDIHKKPENGRTFKFMLFAVWMKVFNMK